MTEFIVIFNERTYGSNGYTSTEEHEEFADLPAVERFINSQLRRNRWMRPSDFRVYSCRRANILQGGKPVESQSRLSSLN